MTILQTSSPARRDPVAAPSCLRASCLLPSSRAFTFIEVLFAIIILGVGMIMVAALLPVAIQQTAEVKDDVVSRTVAENAQSMLRDAIPDQRFIPPTGPIGSGDPFFAWHSLQSAVVTTARPPVRRPPYVRTPLLSIPPVYAGPNSGSFQFEDKVNPFLLTLGDRAFSPDPRFQWIPFWAMPGTGAALDLRVLVTRIRNVDATPDYGWRLTSGSGPRSHFDNPDNGPHLVSVILVDGTDDRDEAYASPVLGSPYPDNLPNGFPHPFPGPTSPDLVIFTGDTSGGATPDAGPLVAAEGAFLIIAALPDDALQDDRVKFIGKVYRLGRQRPDLSQPSNPRGVWELDPSFDIQTSFLPDNPERSFRQFEWRLNRNAGSGGDEERVLAWIVGRGLRDPSLPYNASTNPYVGPAQDLFISEAFRID